MFLHRLRQSRTRNIVAFWLIPLALLSLGLRVCLHASDTTNPGLAHATAIHLENDLASIADLDDANNGHVSSALALFKIGKLIDTLAFAAILTTVLLLFLPRQAVRIPALVEAVPVLSGDHRFRPPLRAPPR